MRDANPPRNNPHDESEQGQQVKQTNVSPRRPGWQPPLPTAADGQPVPSLFPSCHGRYRQEGEPQPGGMGMVYKAWDEKLKAHVAIKRILPEHVRDAAARQRFSNEARIQNALGNIDGIVRLKHYDEDEVGPYLILDWIDGHSLAELQPRSSAPLHWRQAAALCQRAAKILQKAHSLNFVHRDIKPGNILLDMQGGVWICDFGLVRSTKDSPAISLPSLTEAGALLGTLQYISPEQEEDPTTVQPTSDIYSLGVTLHYLVTGQRISLHTRGIPKELLPIIVRATEPDPRDRFASMTEFAQALEVALQSAPVTAPAPLQCPCHERWVTETQQAWGRHLGVGIELPGPHGLNFRLLPPGSFLMGSTESQSQLQAAGFVFPPAVVVTDEQPQHRVQLSKPFWMGTTAVTKRAFAAFVNATGYVTEPERDGKGGWGYVEKKRHSEQRAEFSWRNTGFAQTDDHPVVNVTWNDATAFVEWLNTQPRAKAVTGRFRLPTEAEYEYACRAGTSTRFWTGNEISSLQGAANVLDQSFQQAWPKVDYGVFQPFAFNDGHAFTSPVGSYRANGFGLYDMSGNVWSWCSDWYAANYYAKSPAIDPSGPGSGSSRVLRGGSWSDVPVFVRSGSRLNFSPGRRYGNIGLRLCVEL